MENSGWVKDVIVLLTGPSGKSALLKSRGLKEILDDFRPDLVEWSVIRASRDPQVRNHPFFPQGVAGGVEYQEYNSQWGLWEKHFGAPWAVDEENGVAMDVHGKPIPHLAWSGAKEGTRWHVCHNAPKWHEFQKSSVVELTKHPDLVGVRQDNIGMPAGVAVRGCYCRWCKDAFRRYLSERVSVVALQGLGLEDPRTFDVAAYMLKKKYLGNAEIERALEDPLVVAWMDFMFQSNLRAWRDIAKSVRAARPTMAVCGNQGIANMNAYSSVVLSQVNDAIFLEQWARPAYPSQRLTLGYKAQCAAGRHEKPVWVWGFPSKKSMEQRAEAEVFLAEAFANFATPYFMLYNLFWSKETGVLEIEPTPEVYNVLRTYARFAREHKERLTRVHRSEADVALVYSVPSWLYLYCAAMEFWSGNPLFQRQQRHLARWARALEALHVPYDVIIWGGNPEFWEDEGAEAALSRYRAIVLPNVTALSDVQTGWVKRFAAQGRLVLLSGEVGVRDEHYRRRPVPALQDAQSPSKGRVVSVEKEVFEAAPDVAGARLTSILRTALTDSEQVIQTTAPPTVFINPARRGATLLVHLLNYAHATVGEQGSFRVSLRLPPDDEGPARQPRTLEAFVASPDEPARRLDVNVAGGRVVFTLPKLRVWALVWIEPHG